MLNATAKRKAAAIAICATLAACLTLSLSSPPKAEAGTSAYCNNQKLNGLTICGGAIRQMYQLMGWGDQHSVCIWASGSPAGGGGAYTSCSGGPGAGVYTPTFSPILAYPIIGNNASGWNIVHGVVYQP